jgi:hypothetical protein
VAAPIFTPSFHDHKNQLHSANQARRRERARRTGLKAKGGISQAHPTRFLCVGHMTAKHYSFDILLNIWLEFIILQELLNLPKSKMFFIPKDFYIVKMLVCLESFIYSSSKFHYRLIRSL